MLEPPYIGPVGLWIEQFGPLVQERHYLHLRQDASHGLDDVNVELNAQAGAAGLWRVFAEGLDAVDQDSAFSRAQDNVSLPHIQPSSFADPALIFGATMQAYLPLLHLAKHLNWMAGGNKSCILQYGEGLAAVAEEAVAVEEAEQ